MAKPIFVVGRNRSGTKWLTNIIANTSDVSCVQHEEHFGVLEATDILYTLPLLFGDLTISENYISYIDCISGTDFFRLAGGKTDVLLKNGCKSQYKVFKKLMNDYAARQGNNYWVQKIGPGNISEIFNHFEEATYIFIIRGLVPNIKSVIALEMKEQPEASFKKRLFGHTLRYLTDLKIVEKYRHCDKAIFVRYEDLINETEETAGKIFRHIGVRKDGKIEPINFSRNTSFQGGKERKEIITGKEVLFMKLVYNLLKSLPSFFYEALGRIYRRRSRGRLFSECQRKVLSLKMRKKEIGAL